MNQFAEDTTAYWKTFLIEVHSNGNPPDLLSDIFSDFSVEDTEDAYLHKLSGEESTFIVDHLEDRFWSFHTRDPVKETDAILKDAVGSRRDLDLVWLPSQHLRMVWPDERPAYLKSDFRGGRLLPPDEGIQDLAVQLTGPAADSLLEWIADKHGNSISFDRILFNIVDPDYGRLHIGVTRQGRFVARGDSFELHQMIVRRVVYHYNRFVELVEKQIIAWAMATDGFGRISGTPIGIEFSRSIPDFDKFLEELFSCRAPFRLWGIPKRTASSSATIEAVDLHVGQRLSIDVCDRWMRIYLLSGNCGNTVARLVANLQQHYDAALRLSNPELHQALTLSVAEG